MREVDPRSRFSRRTVLAGAASAVPAAAIAAKTGLGVSQAWADEAQALGPAELKTMVRMARDIYPHDFLAEAYYIAAVMPWDKKAAADPAVKAMLSEGVRRLDQDAQDTFNVAYLDVPWEADRVTLLRGIEHTDFFKKIRSDMIVSLYNQHEIWPKFGYEGSSADKGGYIHRGFNDIDWLPKV